MSADPDLPAPVLAVLRSIHGSLRPGTDELPDPATLTAVARGEYDGVTARERAKAVSALARHPDGGADPALYTELATSSQAPRQVRTSAVAALRYLPPEQAEPAALDLQELLEDDPTLQLEIIGVLTVVGGREAFADIGNPHDVAGTLGDPGTFEDIRTAREAFAQAVIGHRHRLEDTPRFNVDGVDRAGLSGSSVTGSVVEFAETVTDVSGPLYGVTPRADGLELRFGEGGLRSVLVLDRTVTTASADEFVSAPSLWGVMLTPNEETGEAEPSLLAVAAPTDDDGVATTFVRPDGKAVYAGRGVPADGGLEFALTDTGLVGTMPTRLRLQVGAESVALADGTVDVEQAVTQTPEPGPG